MTLLFHVPDALLLDFMYTWCEPTDLAKLDTAFCNKSERKAILQVFQSLFFTVSGSFNYCQKTEFISWVGCRGIRLNSLSCVCKPAFLEHITEANVCYSKLKSLNVKQDFSSVKKVPDIPLIMLINTCMFLEHLSLNINTLSDIDQFDKKVLGNLRSLVLDMRDVEARSIISIVSMCQQLRSLRLRSFRSFMSFDDFKNIFRQNIHMSTFYLRSITLSLNDIEWISDNCLSLSELGVRIGCNMGEQDRLVNLTRKFSKLNFSSTFVGGALIKHIEHKLHISQFYNHDLHFWLANLTGLNRVVLSCNMEPLSETSADVITQFNPNVTQISIEFGKCFTSSLNALQKIVSLPQLVKLEFSDSHNMPLTSIDLDVFLFDQKNSFQTLIIRQISVSADKIIEILTANPQITTLDVFFYKLDTVLFFYSGRSKKYEYHRQNVKLVEEYLVTNNRKITLKEYLECEK